MDVGYPAELASPRAIPAQWAALYIAGPHQVHRDDQFWPEALAPATLRPPKDGDTPQSSGDRHSYQPGLGRIRDICGRYSLASHAG
jgi:hypothetical protein